MLVRNMENMGVSCCFLSFGDANLHCQERWVLFGNLMDPTCHDSFENMGAKATATPDLQDEALDYSEPWARIRVGMSPMATIGWRSQVFISWVSSCSCSLLLHLCKSVLCWMSYSHAVWDFFFCVFWLGGSLRRGATKHKVTTFFLFVAWHVHPSKTDPLMQVVLQWPRLKGRACSTPLREVLGVYGGGEHVSVSQLGYAPWTTGRH
jgi:hypothetical protein